MNVIIRAADPQRWTVDGSECAAEVGVETWANGLADCRIAMLGTEHSVDEDMR